MRYLPTPNRILLLIGLSLIIFSYIAVFQAKSGLKEYTLLQHQTPLRYVGPDTPSNNSPAIIIAHGFSGSQQLMLGYAYTFARAGYATMSVDFTGHASNPAPIDIGKRKGALQSDLESAYEALVAIDHVSADKIAILGHSMGSGAILHQSVEHPDLYRSTIAISPSFENLDTNDSIPHNLLIQAGGWEKPFVKNAERLLEMSGGLNENFSQQSARKLSIIPNVEHISILFNHSSHQEALSWVNHSIEHTTIKTYKDLRVLWFVVHVVAWLLLILGIKPLISRFLLEKADSILIPSNTRLFLGLFIAPPIAVLVMVLFAQIYPKIGGIGGLLVGGAFALWLFIVGLVWIGITRNISFPNRHEIISGLIFFVLLSLSFGFMAQTVWLPYFLIPERLIKWLVISLACIPFFLGMGYLLFEKSWKQRLGAWLGISVSLLIGTLLLINFVPGTGFLILIAPTVPLVIGVVVAGGSTFRRPWVFALGGGLYFAWQMAMLFPLS